MTKFKTKSLEQFANLMIEKINQVSDDWKKPWITNTLGLPRNAITGRTYRGFNDLMLSIQTEKMGYVYPAFLTYKQAEDAGSHVLKGSRGFLVCLYMPNYQSRENPSEFIKPIEYFNLSDEERKNYKYHAMLKDFTVFNVAQTSIEKDNPELYAKIISRFPQNKLNDESGMMVSPELDNIIKEQSWLCPIHVKESNRAFYRTIDDYIVNPLKSQFESGEKFYSTLLHEMAHSTGAESRLDRIHSKYFGDPNYAKEELVAELTAALTALSLQITSGLQEHNAQYLKNWLNALKGEPNFIFTLLTDVNKASSMILDVINPKEELDVSFKKEHAEDFTKVEAVKPTVQIPEETFFGLQKGQLYQFGSDKPVQFTGATAGGILNFKYTDSGKTFQLQTNGKPPKGLHPFSPENDLNISTFDELTPKTKFSKDELPKDALKLLGVKFSELSEVNKCRLLSGKETSELTVKNAEGLDIQAKLSLKRNEDNSVSLVCKPVVGEQLRMGIKM